MHRNSQLLRQTNERPVLPPLVRQLKDTDLFVSRSINPPPNRGIVKNQSSKSDIEGLIGKYIGLNRNVLC
jgi:hypothetical protein